MTNADNDGFRFVSFADPQATTCTRRQAHVASASDKSTQARDSMSDQGGVGGLRYWWECAVTRSASWRRRLW